ncbi:hypothetical protein C0J52_17001, partial [Blattella germanica]
IPESGYCAQEKNLPARISSITRSGHLEISETWNSLLRGIIIGMVKNVSVLKLSTCHYFETIYNYQRLPPFTFNMLHFTIIIH